MPSKMTAQEERNVKSVEDWARAWETDAARMVDKVYADSTEVFVPLQGLYMVKTGKSKADWRAVEIANQKLYKMRKLTLAKVVPSEDKVAVEVLVTETNLIDRTRERWFSAFLRFDKDGRIVSDHTYQLHAEVTPDPARAHNDDIRAKMEALRNAHQKIMAQQ